MKSLCLTLLAASAFFALTANGKSAFLYVVNDFGDYWSYHFAGKKINVTYDMDHKKQKQLDREVDIGDIDIAASLNGLPAIQAVSSDEMSNMAYIKLICKSNKPYCVYSHFEPNTYNVLPIFCQITKGQIGKDQIGADCAAFVQAALSVP